MDLGSSPPYKITRQMVAGDAHADVEPLYGPTYLPRKFKIAIAIPPNNDGMAQYYHASPPTPRIS